MNDTVSQFVSFMKSLPLSRKVSIAFVFILLITGFVFMFIWANQISYQVLFNNLSPEDAGAIVSRLNERQVPYKLEANGAIILVPAEKIYELRLSLAGDNLPNGGAVGFEIFDHTDFGTTKFVQEVNYRRALQGELARTINQFKEVKGSRVFLVIPKESLFIEDRKPASASIQLDLLSSLPPRKLAAIVHLVANAVEALEPEHITVVDTRGRVIFKGATSEDSSELLSGAQLDYKKKIEDEAKKNVESMLEGIVGVGKAIVRVNADINFNKITLNEEEYDPNTAVIRSKRNIEEATETGPSKGNAGQTIINERRGIVESQDAVQNKRTKKDVVTNYEINRVTRAIVKPAGSIKRLSVAAVIDAIYKTEKLEDGSVKKSYVMRSENELEQFEKVVKGAIGYDEDREDRVSVTCIPFSEEISTDMNSAGDARKFNILDAAEKYRKTLVNLLLVVVVFFLVVRPLLKSIRKVSDQGTLRNKELTASANEYEQIPQTAGVRQKERVFEISRNNPEKTEQLLKGWIGE
jgi:flagellar M-ring protein FliF